MALHIDFIKSIQTYLKSPKRCVYETTVFQCKVLRDEDGELGRLELFVLLETPHWQLLEFSILTFSWVLGGCSRCLDAHLGRLVSPLWQLEGWLSAISASVPHCRQQSCAQTWTGSVWNCVADLHSLACRPRCSPGVVWWPALWRPEQRTLYIWVCIILLQSYMWSLPHKTLLILPPRSSLYGLSLDKEWF